jgi:hypothetical protein
VFFKRSEKTLTWLGSWAHHLSAVLPTQLSAASVHRPDPSCSSNWRLSRVPSSPTNLRLCTLTASCRWEKYVLRFCGIAISTCFRVWDLSLTQSSAIRYPGLRRPQRTGGLSVESALSTWTPCSLNIRGLESYRRRSTDRKTYKRERRLQFLIRVNFWELSFLHLVD